MRSQRPDRSGRRFRFYPISVIIYSNPLMKKAFGVGAPWSSARLLRCDLSELRSLPSSCPACPPYLGRKDAGFSRPSLASLPTTPRKGQTSALAQSLSLTGAESDWFAWGRLRAERLKTLGFGFLLQAGRVARAATYLSQPTSLRELDSLVDATA